MNAPLPVQSFISNFKASLGAYKGIDLRQLCACNPAVKGEAWQKSYRPKLTYDSKKGVYVEQTPKELDVATHVDRRMWEADADLQTYQNELARRTPHQDVDFYMTEITPKVVHTGHEFETLDKVFQADDPSSAVIQELTRSFQLKRNMRVLEAVFAESVNRKKLDLRKGSSTFGKTITSQEAWATNAPHNTYTTKGGFFSLKEDAPRLRALADGCNVPDNEKLILLMNPFDASEMQANSFDTMYSIDFVEKKHLDAGTIPEAFGISFVKCNLLDKGQMVAWVKDAVSWTPWQELECDLARNISNQNRPEFYAREVNNVARIDDMGVFVININQE